jgi:hypothetical protein
LTWLYTISFVEMHYVIRKEGEIHPTVEIIKLLPTASHTTSAALQQPSAICGCPQRLTYNLMLEDLDEPYQCYATFFLWETIIELPRAHYLPIPPAVYPNFAVLHK